ncbi:MAG TPA: hypothetical protein VL463_03610, partial [Kofleriaceae bacterium]|nr:hypothetical protein [Kofleriaceae bacterium]
MSSGKRLTIAAAIAVASCGRRAPPGDPPAARGKAALDRGDHLLVEDGSVAGVRASLAEFATAFDAYREAGALGDAGDAVWHASQALHVLGDERTSLALALEARSLYARAGDRVKEGDALDGVATSEAWLGRPEDAFAHYQEALALSRAAGDRYGIAERELGIGFASLRVDRWPEGRRALEDAASIYHALGKTRSEAVARSNLGYLYYLEGDAERSIAAQSEALAIARARADVVQIGKSELNLAGVYLTLEGDAPRALALADDAVALWRARGRARDLPTAMTMLAHARAATGDVDGALATMRQSIDGLRALQMPTELANAQLELGALLARRGDAAGARAALDQAVDGLDRANARIAAARARVERARLERAAGERDRARADLERALDTFESLRAGVAQDELRASYVATVRGAYEQLADLLADGGDARGSFAISERARARVLHDALRLAGADDRGATPAPPSLADAGALAGADTAIVEYLIAPGRSWAWIATDRGVEVVPLAGAAAIDA